MMQRQPVQSSNIADAAFDADSGTMEVTFKSGKRYRYYGVAPGTFEGFMGSESKGYHFMAQIRGKYEMEPVEIEDDEAPQLPPAA